MRKIFLLQIAITAFCSCKQQSNSFDGVEKLKVVDSIYTIYYSNGKKFEEGPMKDGYRVLQWYSWDSDGALIAINTYNDSSAMEGPQYYFYPNGKIKALGFFAEDKPHEYVRNTYVDSVIGEYEIEWIIKSREIGEWRYFDQDGKIDSVIKFD